MKLLSIEELSHYLPSSTYEVYNPYENDIQEISANELIILASLSLADRLAKRHDFDPLDMLLNSVEIEEVLTDRFSELGGLGILNVVREYLDSGHFIITEEGEYRTVIDSFQARELQEEPSEIDMHDRIDASISRYELARGSLELRNARFEDPALLAVSTIQDIHNTPRPETIMTIHLAKQEVLSYKALELILSTFPNLRRITVTPSLYKIHFARSRGKMRLLEESGVEFSVERIWDHPHYDQYPETDEYRAKRSLYQDIFERETDSELLSTLVRMHAYEIIDLNLLHEYLAGNPISIHSLATKHNIYSGWLSKEISTMLCLMGYDIGDPQIHVRANAHRERLKKADREHSQQQELRKFAEANSITIILPGGEERYPPPENLRIKDWSIWQQVATLYYNNPIGWDNFRNEYPNHAKAIELTLQLGENHNTFLTLEQAGQEMGITREGVRFLKNAGLEYLGIE